MVLSATEYFCDIVRGLRVNCNPGEDSDTFGDCCQMREKGGYSIGFSDVIDGTHHGLQVLQDLHIDWRLDVRLFSFCGDNEELALRSKGSKNIRGLMVRGSACQILPP